jgi:hypothetical protein
MERDQLRKVYEAFAVSGRFVSATPLESGPVVDSFHVAADEEAAYLLRRVRPRPSIDVPGMVYNKELVSGHIRNKLIQQNIRDITRKYVTHFRTCRQQPYYKDHEGNYWTLTLWIKEVKTLASVTSPAVAREIGAALGEFKQRTCDFDHRLLRDSMPGYQSLPAWQARARRAALEDETCRGLVERLRPFDDELAAWQRLAAEGAFPARVTHNAFETKSVMFDWNDKPLCVLDLYMVTPGFLHHDFGDAVRSACRAAGEARLDPALFEAFAGGFARVAGRLLARRERETLHLACLLMPYLGAARLLAAFRETGDPADARRAEGEIDFLQDVARRHDLVKDCIDSF